MFKSPLGLLKEFSLEAWLMEKVQVEGTDEQREELQALRKNLDEVEARAGRDNLAYEIIEDFPHSGLPSDIMSVVHQPLAEIEVYRDLSDIAVNDDDAVAQDNGDDDDDQTSA